MTLKRIISYTFLFLLLLIGVAGCSFMQLSPQFGAEAKGKRLQAMQASPHYHDGVFHNPVETNMDIGFKGYVKMIRSRFFDEVENQEPDWYLPVDKIAPAQLERVQDTATIITWFGHSAFLIELDGKRLLVDPMLGERASPISFMGPKRFNEELPIPIEDLPYIDAILISHDHYDHLDYGSIKQLADKTGHFYVALGVGAHLERWGVPAERITELDWWDEAEMAGIKFVATPARHFSGRGFSDRMKTLWASWVILGKNDRIFFSGDTGYFDGFKEIGEKYGPFDITLLECGQYNELWSSIHMMPEQTVQAHLDLKGKLMMPIHWGAFALALHSWTDPIERVTKAAKAQNIMMTTPRIGQSIILGRQTPRSKWWE
ncbi:MBL fold metallo-hydrolase [Pontibacter lucknowensis]|uniref:L-ascorbate metabolism protein UlaG, beta-lactamase superfamily n=1 Tax=Pontibacter lucknowensis TaxID=1077936 RepID=A0A1N6W3Q4_9BACT|nr:MBL fold metallo-hydrolase [Pontibacter lucknowensis]SIQ84767.1 L-ascorbate metabolism protein UlaG, beta-lactamase superfamily [Pontibacter lucknowensis]